MWEDEKMNETVTTNAAETGRTPEPAAQAPAASAPAAGAEVRTGDAIGQAATTQTMPGGTTSEPAAQTVTGGTPQETVTSSAASQPHSFDPLADYHSSQAAPEQPVQQPLQQPVQQTGTGDAATDVLRHTECADVL